MRVFSNTAISLDGRIGTIAREHVQLGSEADRSRMSQLRAQADAVLVGGHTFRSWPQPLLELAEHAAERPRPMLNAVLTRRGLGPFDADAWRTAELLVLAGEEADLSGLSDAEVLTHPDPSPGWALDVLQARGCQSVLVEGGGDLIFQLLAVDRLDELYVTLCPHLIGGIGAPSLVDGRGFDTREIRGLSLIDHTQLGDEIYLHYRVASRD